MPSPRPHRSSVCWLRTLKSGDADRRLGFQIYGFIAADDPTDLDVYSFNARGGTEVWIDVDRTGAALDAVVELITADGTVLASSYDNETLAGLANSAGQGRVAGKRLLHDQSARSGDARGPAWRVRRVRNRITSGVRSQPLKDGSRNSMAVRAAVVIGCSCGCNRWTKSPVRPSATPRSCTPPTGSRCWGCRAIRR